MTQLLELLKPFKKGPLRLFGTDIDTEWRSDWKWDRLRPQLPDLAGKAVCDVGWCDGSAHARLAAGKTGGSVPIRWDRMQRRVRVNCETPYGFLAR